ncbi:SprB repeat-containing protein, partial [Tenacibaculum gallaicum]|uniref:SprB repeat-containing protein n=1 Tax=Tenacibaculum gallaicum TaxID=561505 RepID=UPI000E249451
MKRIITLLIIVLQTLIGFSQERSAKEDLNEAEGYAKLKASLPQKTQKAISKAASGFNLRTIKPDGTSGGINIKGDITFIANNSLSRRGSYPYYPVYPYDGSSSNGNLNMQYIDIDSDPSTFSSSSDILNLPTCSKVVYAGLYWAGVYPYESWDYYNDRSGDPSQIKFKLPTGGYQDVTADETVYDEGFSYVYYKDITTDIQGLATVNPDGHNGTYVAANIRGVRGRDYSGGLGGSAGWTMVVIYENQTLSSKNIAIFDGYADVNGSNDVELSYSGFTTVPVGPNPANPAPVRVSLLAATLEGDRSIYGDRFQIKNTAGNFVNQSTPNTNPSGNFFNGSITRYDQYVTSRTPDSENTLGFDVDLYQLSNPNNSVITNGQTSAEVKFTTSGDVYWPFLNALAVEIIEPKVQLIKTIEDASGNDIQGTPVGLGSELFYNISFQNVGTDDARNTVITDLLPKNVDLLTTTAPNGSVAPDGTRFDIDLPAGVSITAYDPPSTANDNRAELEISVPDNMVLEGGALYNIRMHVQVVTDCSQLRDVCSNEVRNQAFARYEGIRGGVVVNNEPSYAGIDDCDFGIVGTSNFLVDTSGCSFETTQIMCGASITLTAGAGFESYEWRDASGNLLGTTTVPFYDVTSEGTYTVNKIASAASGCINAEETIHVVGYNSEPNPLQPFADQVLTCASNGEELAEVYLCGDSGSRMINLPFDTSSATTVQWFKLDESSCTDVTESGCPNVNTACTWNEVGSGEFSRNFVDAGEYRLDVLYDGRCPQQYYFNVYKATLNPTFIKEDILCGNNGSITVNNIPAGYQYSLTGPGGYNAPFQDSNVFSGLTAAGNYNLSIRVSSASAASCTYTFPPINIQENNIDMDVITTPMQCFNDSAQIRVQVNNVPGDYTYELLQGGSVVGTEGPTANNDFTFNVTDGGAYTVRVTTPQCTATEMIVINEPDELVLTALKTKDITCESGSSDGIIQLTASGGTLDTSSGNNYNFAVWTSQGTDLYTNPSDIPNTAFLTPATNPYTYNVPVGSEGIYRFIVIDDNNCYTISAPVEVTVEPELVFTHSETDVTCNGLTDGTINVSVNGDNLGYAVEYSIDNATWNTTGAFDSLDDGTYTIYIRASKNSYQCLYEIPNIVINEPTALIGGSATATDLECNTSGGTTYGTITFTTPTGGTPNYTYYYKLNSAATYTLAANNPVTGLPAGTYNTRVVDANGCSIDLNNVTIGGLPSAPTLTSSVVYNCDGSGNVTITATPAGTYTYTLGGNSNNTGVFNNVAVGSHTVEVTYGGSCVEDITVTVNAGNEFSGSIVGSTDSECYGSDNGTVTISANNVVGGSFEYSTDGGTTWSMTADNPYRVVGLAAGTYNVFIRETVNGQTCPIDLGNVVINQPEELTLSASATQEVTCNTATGTITASATGGIPPYTFSIDGGATWQSSPVFANVPPRATDYIVMVRDSRNCNECGCTANLFENGGFELPANSATTSQQMNEDLVPGWDSTASDNLIEIWYNGFNGVPAHEGNSFAELNANTVSSLYQEYCTQPGDVINWSVAHRGRSGTDEATVKIGSDLATASVVETMSDGTSAWGVYSGTYTVPVGQSTTVIAFDALSTAGGNNTIGNFIDDVQININRTNCVPVSVPVVEPNTVDFDVTPTLCYDGSGNGEILVEVTSGNNDYQFRIDGGVWQTPATATPDEFTFTGLTEGTYSIEVRDGLGCTIPAKDATILPQLTATITAVSATCNDGQIIITPNGGDGTYEFIVETGAGVQTSHTSSPINVSAGTYTVYVRDKNGGANYCEYTDTVTVNQIAAPTVSSTSTQPNCSTDTGTINVTVGSGTSPYTVTVTGPGGPFVQGPSADVNYSFTGLGDGTYQITVSDANGCPPVATSTETINVPTALAGGSASKTDLMCSPTGTILGTINFTAPTGGTGPYIYYYRLVGAGSYAQIAGTSVSNLPAGDYETKVEDSNGCERILDTVTIADLPAVPAFASTVVYNCDGTGNITITPFDASYTYSLDGAAAQTGANANIFNNVTAGAHTVTVDYGSNCTED